MAVLTHLIVMVLNAIVQQHICFYQGKGGERTQSSRTFCFPYVHAALTPANALYT